MGGAETAGQRAVHVSSSLMVLFRNCLRKIIFFFFFRSGDRLKATTVDVVWSGVDFVGPPASCSGACQGCEVFG